MSQVYALVIRAEGSAQVGRLGPLQFRGTYVYIGSALGRAGRHRIQRHIDMAAGRREGRFWHIDYLLQLGRLEAVISAETEERRECALASKMAQMTAEAVPRFGSSDCRCPSHLFRPDDDDDDPGGIVKQAMASLGLRPEVVAL